MSDLSEKRCAKCSALILKSALFCSNCGEKARVIDNDEVLFYGNCPECGKYNVKCTGTSLPRRYRKCNSCGHKIKTVEVINDKAGAFDLAKEIIRDPRMF